MLPDERVNEGWMLKNSPATWLEYLYVADALSVWRAEVCPRLLVTVL